MDEMLSWQFLGLRELKGI